MEIYMRNLAIEHTSLHALHSRKTNARTHSKNQIKQLAKSIERFGFNNPILIDENNIVLAGHGRVEAAKLLGLSSVPTVKLSHLSEADKRAYVIADNRLAELAGWDRTLLAAEFNDLIDLGFDVDLTGFDPAAIDFILEDVSDSPAGEDDVPQPKASVVTRLGDIWQLGQHHLICADARDPKSYVALLHGNSADMVFTDPPYNVPINGHASGLGRVHHADFAMACGEMNEAEFRQFLQTC
jgi:hypothetical protein